MPDEYSKNGGSIWQCSPTWGLTLEWCSWGCIVTLASCLTTKTLCLQTIMSWCLVLRRPLESWFTSAPCPWAFIFELLNKVLWWFTNVTSTKTDHSSCPHFSSLHLVLLLRETKTKGQKTFQAQTAAQEGSYPSVTFQDSCSSTFLDVSRFWGSVTHRMCVLPVLLTLFTPLLEFWNELKCSTICKGLSQSAFHPIICNAYSGST